MSKKGYIKLDRRILDNMLWLEKPFDYAHAWTDLLLLANHKDLDVIRRGQLMHRKRGDVDTSIGFLANRWGWSENKVRRFIGILNDTGMCTSKGTPYGTTLTIENYTKYQGEAQADGRPNERPDGRADERPDERPDGRHDKNVKECIKNGKRMEKNNTRSRARKPSSFEEILDELRREYELEESGDGQSDRTS